MPEFFFAITWWLLILISAIGIVVFMKMIHFWVMDRFFTPEEIVPVDPDFGDMLDAIWN